MKTSARNQFAGTVKVLVKGPISVEVTITIASGVDVVSIISTGAAELLGLAVGMPVYALINASSVMVAVD